MAPVKPKGPTKAKAKRTQPWEWLLKPSIAPKDPYEPTRRTRQKTESALAKASATRKAASKICEQYGWHAAVPRKARSPRWYRKPKEDVFRNLPGELRNQIYELVLLDDKSNERGCTPDHSIYVHYLNWMEDRDFNHI